MKYSKDFELIFNSFDYTVFTIDDVKLALKEKNISYPYLRLMLHNLIKSGTVKRITNGVYTFHNDMAVIGFAFRPFYYGLENALSFLGISQQVTNDIIITTRNIRTGTRNFYGRNYRIVKIPKNLLFGYNTIKYGNFWIPVSDLEKTLIDMLYFKVQIRAELYKTISKNLDTKKLHKYLKRYDYKFSNMAMKTAKYIVEH